MPAACHVQACTARQYRFVMHNVSNSIHMCGIHVFNNLLWLIDNKRFSDMFMSDVEDRVSKQIIQKHTNA